MLFQSLYYILYTLPSPLYLLNYTSWELVANYRCFLRTYQTKRKTILPRKISSKLRLHILACCIYHILQGCDWILPPASTLPSYLIFSHRCFLILQCYSLQLFPKLWGYVNTFSSYSDQSWNVPCSGWEHLPLISHSSFSFYITTTLCKNHLIFR